VHQEADLTPPPLQEIAVDLVLAVMSSASTATIAPHEWWDRCTSALRSAAERGDTWGEFLTAMARQLQIPSFRSGSVSDLHDLGRDLGDRWPQLRALIHREAIYVVLEARIQKDEQ